MPSFKWVNDGSLMSVYYDGQDGKRNPALEFVNAICKVFELDSTMEEEVFNQLLVLSTVNNNESGTGVSQLCRLLSSGEPATPQSAAADRCGGV